MMNFFVLMSKYDDIPENVNEILKQNGYTNPPYKPGTNVTTIELTEWVMNYEEIQGLSS